MYRATFRRLLCFLLTLLMVFALCGCSDPALKMTTQADFESAMQQCLDLSLYTYDAASATYELKDASQNSELLDFTVDFKSSSSISLPIDFKDLETAGWIKADESIHVIYDTYLNEKGEAVIVAVSESLILRNVIDHYLIIQTYSLGGLKEDFTYDLLKLENAPEFSIANEITNQSRIADVIRVLGNPWNVAYMDDFSIANVPAVQLWFGIYVDGAFTGDLIVTFSGETEEILEIQYHYMQITD